MNQSQYRPIFMGTNILLIVASLIGCASGPHNQALMAAAGTVVGAGGGYLIGDAIGGKHASLIGAAVGGAVGGLLGNQIAQYLDERDRQAASQATQNALDAPIMPNTSGNGNQKTSITWNSDHNPGVRGQTTIVNSGYDTSGRECRAAEEVAYVGGREIKEQVNYCRDQKSGTWTKAV